MEYIVVTLLTVSVSAFIVYRIANKFFGLNLQVKPIILCAACAILISIVLPRVIVSFAGLVGTIGVIAVFAIAFAYFIAYYDDLVEEKTKQQASALPVAAVRDKERADDTDAVPATAVQNNMGPGAEGLAAAACGLPGNGKISIRQAACVSDKAAAPYLGPLKETIPPLTALNPPPVTEQAENLPLPAYTAVAGQNPAQVAQTDETVIGETEPGADETDECTGGDAMDAPLLETLELDDLMDLGFTYKDQHDFNRALTVFRHAVKNYSASEAAPYLAVEIGTILKDKGAYDEAIEALIEGHNLARRKGNDVLEQEFVAIIAYMRIIKNVLLERLTYLVPFNSIPPSLMKMIDKEFDDWRRLEKN